MVRSDAKLTDCALIARELIKCTFESLKCAFDKFTSCTYTAHVLSHLHERYIYVYMYVYVFLARV